MMLTKDGAPPGEAERGADDYKSLEFNGHSTAPHHDAETVRLLSEAQREQERARRRDDAYARRYSLPVVGCRLSTIRPKPVHWLWPDRIARGKVSMIAGNPGLGKSQITASLAAIVTTGGQWPVDRTRCERGAVLLLSAEDDPADTIVPRLQVAGADLDRVETVEAIREITEDGERQRPVSLIDDLDHLEDKAHCMADCALVVIDPISAFLGSGRVDSHNNTDVRGVMQGLQRFAERTQAAVVCVSHLSKGKQAQALMAVMGSLGFVAAARAAYGVFADDSDDGRRMFLPLKNNIGNDRTGLAFRIESATTEDGIASSRVAWEAEPVMRSADSIYQDAGGEATALDEAIDFLESALAEGQRPVPEVKAEAKAADIAPKTLRRAREKLGIRAERTRFDGGWTWALPHHAQPAGHPAPSLSGGHDGHDVGKTSTYEHARGQDGGHDQAHLAHVAHRDHTPKCGQDGRERIVEAIGDRPVDPDAVLELMAPEDVKDLTAGEIPATALEHLIKRATEAA